MRIYDSSTWGPRLLDPWCGDGEVRVEVLGWAVLRPVRDQFFVRPASPALLWTYLRDVGLRAVLRKVASRRAERGRNDKFVSVGLGRVLEGPADAGALVAFLAPNHPLCADRISLARALTQPADELSRLAPPPGRLRFADLREDPRLPGVDGWSPYAGADPVDPGALAPLVEHCLADARLVEAGDPGPVRDRVARAAAAGDEGGRRPACTLIGFGNYARTTLLPFLSRELDVRTIHEIDPCQIGAEPSQRFAWDTSPAPRDDDDADCWAIAGYHHVHAPLAAEALRRGKHAIVEKPPAVDAAALDDLLEADAEHEAGVFVCFQRRYAVFNDWLAADLGTGDAPIDYHCVVYEEPLPALHWYRWPRSGSRLTSNGCHWIDHFLFLNGYAAPVASVVTASSRGTVNCSVELENGAFFTMALTDHGSPRMGVQDVVDLRCGRRSARIVNNSEYVAEGVRRVVRRQRVGKLDAYARMYRTIGLRIAAGQPGDSRESLEVPARVTQTLEGQLASA